MPRPPAQRHTLKIDLPEGLLAQFGGETLHEGVPKARIAGAIAAGVGTYLIVRVFQKTLGDVLHELGRAAGWFEQIFTTGTVHRPGLDPEGGEAIFAPDPFAIGMGLVTGGMILAGQNPGEVLKGIGEIVPG